MHGSLHEERNKYGSQQFNLNDGENLLNSAIVHLSNAWYYSSILYFTSISVA